MEIMEMEKPVRGNIEKYKIEFDNYQTRFLILSQHTILLFQEHDLNRNYLYHQQ